MYRRRSLFSSHQRDGKQQETNWKCILCIWKEENYLHAISWLIYDPQFHINQWQPVPWHDSAVGEAKEELPTIDGISSTNWYSLRTLIMMISLTALLLRSMRWTRIMACPGSRLRWLIWSSRSLLPPTIEMSASMTVDFQSYFLKQMKMKINTLIDLFNTIKW